MVVSSFAIGVLGRTLFFTGFGDGVLTILFINLLGITPVCECFISLFYLVLTCYRSVSSQHLDPDSVFDK